jgi:hypothetical protein
MKLAEIYEMERGNRKLDNLLARMDQSQKAWMQGEPGPDNSLQLCHDVLPLPNLLPGPVPVSVPIYTPKSSPPSPCSRPLTP